MPGTTDLAVRDDRAPAGVPTGALAIEAGQTSWTTMQAAALGQLGIADAPEGDKQVFLHVSQRTGLDPFAKQIYMIGRNEKKNVKRGERWIEEWSTKYTIQTGIEGFRVIRGRAERTEGVRGILSRPVYYNGQGDEFKVWFFKNPPAAVELTYTVRDRNGVETPYTSILRFDEYVQTKKQTVNGTETLVPVSQWATKPTHMLEKCTEADVYRKAFPQDYSGVDLADAMPAPDPADAPPVQPRRVRVTADQARARAPRVVDVQGEVIEDAEVIEDVPPAPDSPAAVAVAPSAERAGGTRRRSAPPADGALSPAQVIEGHMARLGTETSRDARLRLTGRLAGKVITTTDELTPAQQAAVIRDLDGCKDGSDLDLLLAEIELRSDPREVATDGQ